MFLNIIAFLSAKFVLGWLANKHQLDNYQFCDDDMTECMRLLVRSNPDLTDVLDNNGWSAFHFAADNDLPYSVDFLLSWANINVAYIADKKYKKTAFHVAAYKGYTNVIEKFLEYLPDIVDSVDGNGQNILHIAIKQNQNFLLKFILSKTWKFDTLNTLMIQKDIEGNTPLHLIAKLGYYIPELREWIQKTDQEVVDNTNLTPSEALYQYYSPVIRDDEEVGGVHPKRDNFYYFWNDWCGGRIRSWLRPVYRNIRNYYGNLVFVRRRPPFDIDFVRRPSSPASDGHSSSVRTDSSV
ncbi:hypothetical protein ACET3Z_004194 [Daucus carota]